MASCRAAKPTRFAPIWKPAGSAGPQVEELQVAVGDCVRYRKNVLGACLPPPPAPWRALDFDKADAELASQSIFARLANFFSPTRNAPLRWAASGVAVLALAAGIFLQLRETPKVEAAVLLKKAVAVSHSRPVGGRRLRITTRTGSLTRSIGAASRPAASTPAETELAHLFQGARYDWNDPLSATAYSEWRDQLPQQKGRSRFRAEFLRHHHHHRRWRTRECHLEAAHHGPGAAPGTV